MTAATQRPRQFVAKRSGQMCIWALCFGDFHLGQQMKVTRPPGRDPATHLRTRPPGRDPATLQVDRPAEGDSPTRPPGRTPATPC